MSATIARCVPLHAKWSQLNSKSQPMVLNGFPFHLALALALIFVEVFYAKCLVREGGSFFRGDVYLTYSVPSVPSCVSTVVVTVSQTQTDQSPRPRPRPGPGPGPGQGQARGRTGAQPQGQAQSQGQAQTHRRSHRHTQSHTHTQGQARGRARGRGRRARAVSHNSELNRAGAHRGRPIATELRTHVYEAQIAICGCCRMPGLCYTYDVWYWVMYKVFSEQYFHSSSSSLAFPIIWGRRYGCRSSLSSTPRLLPRPLSLPQSAACLFCTHPSSPRIFTCGLFPWAFCSKEKVHELGLLSTDSHSPLARAFLHVSKYSVMSTSLPPHSTMSLTNVIDFGASFLTLSVHQYMKKRYGLKADPWCNPNSTLKLLPSPATLRTFVLHSLYVSCTNFSGTCLSLMVLQISTLLPRHSVVCLLAIFSLQVWLFEIYDGSIASEPRARDAN